MLTLENLLIVGGILHFGILTAGILVPIVLEWRTALQGLSPFMRRLVWVYACFIGLTVIGFGVTTLLNSAALAGGGPLARTVCGFIAIFWLCRLFVQLLVFDAKPYMRSLFLKLGYHGLTASFSYFIAVYGAAALLP